MTGVPIHRITPLSGGDIAAAYRVDCGQMTCFVKAMDGQRGSSVLEAEEKGLLALRSVTGVRTPELLGRTRHEDTHFLVLEHIFQGAHADGTELGHMLAKLHRSNGRAHGWDSANFIGRLDQVNTYESDWPTFWRDHRLNPQIKLAMDHQLLPDSLTKKLDLLLDKVSGIAPEIKPSLLHGDLWNGNVLYDTEGQPYLVDPAVYYGHREVDLAMMKLFGGFDQSTFEAYHESFPLLPDWKDRIAFYQIYYVLVHVNLFGSSYLSSLEEKVERYV